LVLRARHIDERGSFEMAFEFEEIRTQVADFPDIQQINLLHGLEGSIRGFHYSEVDENHWKVITPISGRVRDAFLDLRNLSDTFGLAGFIDLTPEDRISVVIPPGFAHGVQTLSQSSVTVYGTNISYKNNKEKAINPMHSGLDQIWKNSRLLSQRDLQAPDFPGSTEIFKVTDANWGVEK